MSSKSIKIFLRFIYFINFMIHFVNHNEHICLSEKLIFFLNQSNFKIFLNLIVCWSPYHLFYQVNSNYSLKKILLNQFRQDVNLIIINT